MDAIARFAEHVAATRYDDLPPAAVAAAQTFILDSLGVGIAGSAGPWADDLIACHDLGAVPDAARVWVRGTALPANAAALCNAYQLHNSEFDCVHEAAVVHPMAVVLPVLLAEVDRRGDPVAGRDLILAVTLGVDVACHLGVAAKGPLRFFRPATAGAFGATMALGKLRGFDTETLVNACGATLAQLSGTMQAHTEGSILLPLQVGFNARNAVLAADMAARGLIGPRNVLEGPFGYFPLFESAHDLPAVLERLGRVWRITEVAHKPFPSGRATHGIVDGVLTLQREHGFAADAVTAVAARVPPLTHRLVGRPPKPDMAPNYARLCAPYVAARALLQGTVGVADFGPPTLTDATSLALANRITVTADDNPDPNAMTPVTVTVTLAGGPRHDITLDVVYGNPARPMSREAHLDKFRSNCQTGARPLPLANAERLIALVDDLPALADARSLLDLLMA
jgi:2-methylcitrate dehydratase PrpD